MQDLRNSRITGQLLLISLNFRCTALRSRSLHSQNWPALLVKPKLVRDPGAGLHGLPSQVPPCCHGTGRHAVPFQRRGLRKMAPRYRDSAGKRSDPAKFCSGSAHGVGMTEHLRRRCSQAARLCLRFASETFTQHILCVTLRSFIPGAQGTPRPCAGSKLRTIWRCVLSRVCTVTLIAPLSPAVAPLPVSLQSSRQLAGILHANVAAPLF